MTMGSDFEVEHYLDHQATIFLERFDPHTYLYLSRVMDYFDPFAERRRRRRARASCWSPSTATGASAPSTPSTSRASCDALGADVRHHEVVSPWGHDSFLMDVPEYHALVRDFSGRIAGRCALCGDACHRALRDPPRRPLRLLLGAGSPPTCPPGRRCKVLELETINRFWASDPALTVEALAERLRGRLGASRAPRVLVGWGVGGVVADALAAPARRVVVLDAPAPGALTRRADRGAAAALVRHVRRRSPRPRCTVDPGAADARACRATPPSRRARCARDTSLAAVERCFEEHAARVLRDHRLTADYAPSGTPLTVVKAAHSLVPESPALGWDRFGPVERLGSGGDHYSMLTDGAAAAHLAMLLRRWLAPAFASAA